MTSRTTQRFRELLAKLPQEIRRQARASYRLFRDNPSHPSLQFKRVHASLPIYSARISLGYRAVGTVDQGCIVWFWIGPHSEYDRLLRKL